MKHGNSDTKHSLSADPVPQYKMGTQHLGTESSWGLGGGGNGMARVDWFVTIDNVNLAKDKIYSLSNNISLTYKTA